MNLTLVRDYAGKVCTLGKLTVGALVLETLERPWIAYPPYLCGHPDTSCVPAGVYSLALHDTPKFPKHFALVNEGLGIYHEVLPAGVVGRTACLIHAANYVTQLEGCCSVGRERQFVGDQWIVGNSRDAYEALMSVVPWEEGHAISIEYAPGVCQSPQS